MESNNEVEAAKQEAREKARRASRQAVHAAKNTAAAAKAATKVVEEVVEEEVHDTADKVKATAQDATKAVKRIWGMPISAITVGQVTLAVGVAGVATFFAGKQVRTLLSDRRMFLESQAKAGHHYRPSSPDIPQS